MKEIVINIQFGGFGLSPLAVKELAKLNGKKCYFFNLEFEETYKPISIEEASKTIMWTAFSIPNPGEVIRNKKPWNEMTSEEQQATNEKHDEYCLDNRDIPRDDPNLIKVVKKLGDKASGKHATLKIVEIPDDVKWVIDEYDGVETIHEEHREWC